MPVEPGQGSDNVMTAAIEAGYETVNDSRGVVVYRPEIKAILAAAVPILLADVAERIGKLAPYNCELRPDGSEDAWVESIHDAHDVVRSAAAGWFK